MKRLEIILAILLITFGIYWSQSKYEISDAKFWQFALTQEDYQFTYLNLDKSKYIRHFITVGEDRQTLLESGLNAAISAAHCQKMIQNSCTEYLFYKHKKVYSVKFELDMSEEEITKTNISIAQLIKRFEHISQRLALRNIPRPPPKFNLNEEAKTADIIVHVEYNKTRIPNRFVGKNGCSLNLNILKDFLNTAEFHMWSSDLTNNMSGSCEISSMLYFYNILASAVTLNGLTEAEKPMSRLLTLEYYRWMHNFDKFPKTQDELMKNSHEFMQYVLNEFIKPK